MTHDSASQLTTEASAPASAPLSDEPLLPIQWGVDAPQTDGSTPSPHEAYFVGWVFSHVGKPVHGIISIEGMPELDFTCNTVRRDVVQHFHGIFDVPADCGFSVTVPLPESASTIVEIILKFSDGTCTTTPVSYRIERSAMLTWPPPPVRTTVISHFYNEEYLLPLWLRHHVPLFDHGILIDRGSTDRSAEICRELAPHWEVRPATCLEFDAEGVDEEVMAIERGCTDWKMVLNTTEFLHVRSKESFLSAIQSFGRRTYALRLVFLVDPLQVNYPAFDTCRPIPVQRHHGWLPPMFRGCRFLHNHVDGRYAPGRHETSHRSDIFPQDGAVVLKLLFSPWNEAFRRRKLQIHGTLSQKTRELCQGRNHVATAAELDKHYESQSEIARNLREYPGLRWLFEES
jgi:hypothetical protein